MSRPTTFGVITSAGGAARMQGSLRLASERCARSNFESRSGMT
jgi:hypothetical protein